VIKPSLEDVEKLFPKVEFQFGVVKFLNGGSRPHLIDYHKEVEWPDVLLLALAEKLTPLVGRLLTGHQVMDICRLLRTPITNWLSRIPEGSTEIPDFIVDLADDGKRFILGWINSVEYSSFYDLRDNCRESQVLVGLAPEEAHLYNMAVMFIKLQRAVQSQLSEKNAVHAATTEVEQYQAALEQSGYLRDDAGGDSDRPVRDGGANVVAGNNPVGAA
jgi:hypothetical protein